MRNRCINGPDYANLNRFELLGKVNWCVFFRTVNAQVCIDGGGVQGRRLRVLRTPVERYVA